MIVAEGARNVVCVGAKPIAVTNCLNFASPERPEVMRAFSDVIDGMKEACEIFETPVMSGNVSFYNETDGRGILPTPVIGMVGLIEDTRGIISQGFKNEGDIIAILGETKDDLSVSEFAQTVMGYSTNELIENGRVPQIDLNLEKLVQDTCLKLSGEYLLNQPTIVPTAVWRSTIAESCFSSLNHREIGAQIDIQNEALSTETILFGESPSRIVISFAHDNADKVKAIVADCPFKIIGRVGGEDLEIKLNGTDVVSEKIAVLENIWKHSLENNLKN